MLLLPAAARAHNEAGRVRPGLPAPDLRLTLHDCRKTTLPKLLSGRTTALQTMFTTCSATCPIQGALFAAVQAQLMSAPKQIQLVSLTIDPLGDDTKAMQAWLKRYGAGPRWLGAIPEVNDVDRLFDFVKARNVGADRHTAQAYLFNSRAELVMRTVDFPPPEGLTAMLLTLSKNDAPA